MKKTLLFLSILIFTFSLNAQIMDVSPFNSEWPETYIETNLSKVQLKALSHDFSVDKVKFEGNDCFKVRLCINHKDYERFLSLGIPFTIVSGEKVTVRMAHSYAELTNDWDRYPTYSTYLATMDTFQSKHPDICHIETILNNTAANHKILAAHISNDLQNRGNKPAFFYTSTMHGDEVTGYYVLLRLIDYLLNNYDTDPQVQNIINNVDLWICPLENPDGTYRNHNDSLGDSPYSTRANYADIDLNRSYPVAGQSYTWNETFPDEVQAMVNFGRERHFTMSANLHGGAEVFNYPWDRWASDEKTHADDNWWSHVGNNFANTCHNQNYWYFQDEYGGVTEGGDWYCIDGSRQDCYTYFLGCREVTLEVSSSKVVSSRNLYKYWNYLHQAMLDYIEESLNGFRGIVTDSVTGLPLEAMVFVNNYDCDNSEVHTLLPDGNYHRPIKGGAYSVTFSAEGYYPKTMNISVTDGQCIVQDVQLVPEGWGVDEHDSPAFVIHPNPTHGFLYVTSMVRPPKQFDFQMFDMTGRLIHRTKVEAGTSTLDITTLPAGTYAIRILDDKQVIYRTTIVKE